MKYYQLTPGERHIISAMRKQGFKPAAIARALNRARSTITREIYRNSCNDGYRPTKAQSRAQARRWRSRRNNRFTAKDMELIVGYLKCQWSPEQIAGFIALTGGRTISHETIYQYIWQNKKAGGGHYRYLRQSQKRRRKRYRSHDSRGKLPGKRMIAQRPVAVNSRRTFGHWEIDTMLGKGSKHCVVALVERKTGFTLIGKITARTAEQTNKRATQLLLRDGIRARTITADNGTEFHGYKHIEHNTKSTFYFANPHHSWERGTCENTIGLIRQYLPKGKNLKSLSQHQCDQIAISLNTRPRKRLGFRTPEEAYVQHL